MKFIQSQSFKKYLKLSLYCLILGFLLVAIYDYRLDLQKGYQLIDHTTLCLLILFHIPIIALGGLAFYVFSLGAKKIQQKDAIGLSFIANSLNQIMPYRPGMIYRYLFLKSKYQMSLGLFISIMSLYLLFTLIVSLLFILIGWWQGQLYAIEIKNFAYLGLCLLLLVPLALVFTQPSQNLAGEHNPKLLEKFQIIKKSLLIPKYLFINAIIFLAIQGITTVNFYIIFNALNFEMAWATCMFFAGMLSLTSVINVTPGNIGVSESLIATMTLALYQDFSMGLLAGLLFRVTQWIPGMFLGVLFGWLLQKRPA